MTKVVIKKRNPEPDFVVVNSAAPNDGEVESLTRQVQRIQLENQQGRFNLLELIQAPKKSIELQSAIRMVVQWQRALEEGLLRFHFPERFEKFDPNSRRLKDVYGIILDKEQARRFFSKKSVRRVREISKMVEFKALEKYSNLTVLPIIIDEQQIGALVSRISEAECLLECDPAEIYLYHAMKKVYHELAHHPYHKVIISTCNAGRRQ